MAGRAGGVEWLLALLDGRGGAPALVEDGGAPLSYAALADRARAQEGALRGAGVRPGDVVAVRAGHSAAGVALLLGLMRLRAVAMPLPDGAGGEVPPGLLDAACVRCVANARAGSLELRQVDGVHPLLHELREEGAAGLVVLSSGTSGGAAKAALHGVDRLLAKFQARPPRPLRTLAFLHVDHLGGFNTVMGALCAGGTAVLASGRSVEAVARAVERHRVELLPATPTFLKMMLVAGAHRRFDLSSLRLVTYGTEPMPDSVLQAVREALPHVRLKQTYGLTELGVLPTLSRDGDSLWLRVGGVPGVETRVVDGTLRIRAASAMLGYLNVPSPFDAEGWYDTGDLVEEDGEWIRIRARASEVINVAGAKVIPSEVESVLLAAPNVAAAAVRGRPSPVTGQVVVAEVGTARPEDEAALARRLREHCRARLAPHQVPAVIRLAGGVLLSHRFKTVRRDGDG